MTDHPEGPRSAAPRPAYAWNWVGLILLVAAVVGYWQNSGTDGPPPDAGSTSIDASRPEGEPEGEPEAPSAKQAAPAGAADPGADDAPEPHDESAAPSPPAGLRPVPELEPGANGVARFNNGARLPTLNGIETPVPITWPPDSDWSPVIGVGRDNGWDWYVHEDGTWSTTAMVPTNGVLQPTGLLRSPRSSLPLRDGSATGRGQR